MTYKPIIEKLMEEVFNKGNLAHVDQICSPTAMLHDPVFPDAPVGPEAVKQLAGMYRKAFPDLRIEIEDLIEQGERVAIRWKATGTQKGNLFGISPTQKFITVTGQTFFKFAKGYINEVWTNGDLLKLLQELKLELPIKLQSEAYV